jgi:hydroxymethylbilane synthase
MIEHRMTKTLLRIGTRGSPLAMWQAQWVAQRLAAIDVECELVIITTRGDSKTGGTIESLGEPGVFTKELQRSLLEGRIDLTVHSLKDLPTDEVPGLILAAVPLRDSPHDVLVSRSGDELGKLPPGARIGTGSLRRRCQLLHQRADLQMTDIRGNVDTRLKKLREGQYDAIVLAEAGLNRLGLSHEITQLLPPSVMLPAVGQGALAVETQTDDRMTRETVAKIDDRAVHQSVLAERSMLSALQGGCLAPIAAWGRIESDNRLHLSANVLSLDGSRCLATELLGNTADAEIIGQQVAERLLAAGAADLIAQARTAS